MTNQGLRHRKTGLERLRDNITRSWRLYLMLIPGVVYILIFHYFPIYGVQIAFRNYSVARGFWGSPWVGLKYFEKFFASPNSWNIIQNTLILSLYQLAIGFPLPVIFALLLNQANGRRFKLFVQNATYAPHFISVVVLVGIMNVFFSFYGPVNTAIDSMGGTRTLIMGKESAFRHLYVWSTVWQNLGWNSIIYIAALAGIDPELHESAMIDGAGKFKRILHIDMPMLAPTAMIILIMSVGNVLSIGFEKVFLMQNSLNLEVSEILSTYIYKKGLQSFDYSFSTAIGLMNNVVNLILLVSVNTISRRVTGNSLW